ncbi:MAG: ATP-binding cassette domain-containing protein [Negativicutes bacterium]|nr:ATP-binding cassette domain-containing protein [Negativicutes bacterium]
MKLEKINFSFDGRPVLQDFSLELPKSGVVVLMGPSGCGKTTLLRLLVGLEQADSGSMQQGFQRPAMMFQEDRLLPQLNVLQNLLVCRPPGGLAEANRRLEQLGLFSEAKRYPAELSGGMKRRLALGRALCYDGDALLLDEPLKGLDELQRRRLWQVIRAEGRQRLVIWVSHDRQEAAQVADRFLLLQGPPLQIVEDRINLMSE